MRKLILIFPLITSCAFQQKMNASKYLDASFISYKECLASHTIKSCESKRLIYQADLENYQRAESRLSHSITGLQSGAAYSTPAYTSPIIDNTASQNMEQQRQTEILENMERQERLRRLQ